MAGALLVVAGTVNAGGKYGGGSGGIQGMIQSMQEHGMFD